MKAKYLLDDELDQLKATLLKFRHLDVRNVLMLDLLLATGCRASELLLIRRSDLDLREGTVFISALKNSISRPIPLDSQLFSRLVAYSLSFSPDAHLFKVSYQRLYQVWLEYRPCPKGLHSLRHTKAIRAFKRTRDIHLVRRALGHRSLSSTLVYQDYVVSTEELRALTDV